jgi:rod shape-determining protein MreC
MKIFNLQQKIILVAGLVVLVIFLHLLGLLTKTFNLATAVLYRVSSPIHQASVSLIKNVETKHECTAETITQLEQFKLENSKLRTLAAENAALKSALNFKEKELGQTILARVIAESSDITNRGLIIDRGAEDGLKSGQPAIVDDGIIIGKIKSVRKNSAVVLLLTDSTSRLAVAIQGGGDILGLLEGDRGLSMGISLIPQNEQVSLGDMVITSGIEAEIRRGLIIGTIERVEKDEQKPFQTATVTPFERARFPIFVQIPINDQTN